MAFFIKYEFWYNYLHILRHRGVPVYSVSSIFRPDQVFFKWYGWEYAHVLKCFSNFFVQNEESKRLLEGIGVKDTMVVGDTRFDRVLQIKEACKNLPLVEKFVGTRLGSPVNGARQRRVFVAGSSWLPDEEIFLKYFNEHKDWKLIIAPHVIDEDHLKQIQELIKDRKVIRYTKANEENVEDAEVLIIDCFGLLSSVYHYGDIAYVGGGFGAGIHNVLEAAVWQMPVIFGPNNKHFDEAQGLLKSGGGFEITDDESFRKIMDGLSSDSLLMKKCGRKASTFVQSLSGATEKILSSIEL